MGYGVSKLLNSQEEKRGGTTKVKKKRFLSVFIGLVTSISVFSNTTFRAQTAYNPMNENGVNGFARQKLNYPWCLVTCLKIVLRDVNDKYPPGGLPLLGHLNQNTIRAMALAGPSVPLPPVLVGAGPVIMPIGTYAGDRRDIEESIVRNLFFQHLTIPSDESIRTFNQLAGAHSIAFRNVTNTLFTAQIQNGAGVLNQTVMNSPLRIAGFSLLLKTLTLPLLQQLWNDLRNPPLPTPQVVPPTNIENIVQCESDQALFNEVNAMVHADGAGNNFVLAPSDVSNADYATAVNTIYNEIKNHQRMVILIFQNPRGARHACVAYNSVIFNEADGQTQNVVQAYNPHGFQFNVKTQARHSDMGGNLGNDWVLVQYVPLNY